MAELNLQALGDGTKVFDMMTEAIASAQGALAALEAQQAAYQKQAEDFINNAVIPEIIKIDELKDQYLALAKDAGNAAAEMLGKAEAAAQKLPGGEKLLEIAGKAVEAFNNAIPLIEGSLSDLPGKYIGNPPALPGDSQSLTFPGI
jgi:hypothetical protein